MSHEGGGKSRHKHSRANTKPYDRPKSLVGRFKDAVVSYLYPSWLASWPKQNDDNDEVVNNNDTWTVSKSALNASTPTQTFLLPSSSSNNASPSNAPPSRLLNKPKIPLDHPPYFRSNHDREPYKTSATPPFFADANDEPVPGPSTSTPIAASSYSAALANAREFAAARMRRGGDENENISIKETNRVATSANQPAILNVTNNALPSTSANATCNKKVYSKLSDIGKLTEKVNSSDPQKFYQNSDHLTGDSHSECSEESMSTSGCSSMVPHPDKREYQREVLQIGRSSRLSTVDEENPQTSFNDRRTWGFSSELRERNSRSLNWPDTSLSSRSVIKPQPPAVGSKPQFNPSLLGTSLWSDQNSMTRTSLRSESPYLGKVTYGFGSSTKRPRIGSASSSPYSLDSNNRDSVGPTIVVDNFSGDVMSSTAKKILLALEKMSTPLTDAKKIPTNNIVNPELETPLNFNATARRRPNLSNLASKRPSHLNSTYARKAAAPPTNRILTPGSVTVRNISNQSHFESQSSKLPDPFSSNVASYPKLSSKGGGGKVRARQAPMHYSSVNKDEEIVEVPDLPTAVLPIQNLPIFNLLPRSLPKAPVPTNTLPVLKSSDTTAKSLFASSSSTAFDSHPSTPHVPTFTFSTPVVKQDVEFVNGPKVTPSLPNYKFHSPCVEKPSSPIKQSKSTESEITFGYTATKSPKRKSFTQAATELKSGSVMDILGKTASTPPAKASSQESTNLGSLFRPASGTWSCSVCMVPNKAEDLNCVCCNEKKPGSASASASVSTVAPTTPLTTSSFSSFGDKFRPQVDTWECPTCMVRSPKDSDKCVACETKKPGSTSKPKVESKWECDICLVPNESSATQCSACSTLRPKPKSTISASGFKFGFSPSAAATAVTNTTTTSNASNFKFGTTVTSTPASSFTGFKFGVSAADTTTSTSPSNFSFSAKPTVSVSNSGAVATSVITSLGPSSFVTSSKDAISTVASSSIMTPSTDFKIGFQSATSESFSSNAVTSSMASVSSSSSRVADQDQSDAVKSSEQKADSSTTLPPPLAKSVIATSAPFSFNTNAVVSSTIFTTPTSSVKVTKSDSAALSANPVSTIISTTSSSASISSSSTTATPAPGGFAFSFAATTQPTTTPSSSFKFTIPSTASAATPPSNTSAFLNTTTTTTTVASTKPSLSSGTGGFNFSFGGNQSLVKPSPKEGGDLFKSPSFGGPLAGKLGESSSSFKPTAPVFGALSTVGEKSPASNTFTFGTSTSTQISAQPPTTASSTFITDSIKQPAPTFGNAAVSSSTGALNFGSSQPTGVFGAAASSTTLGANNSSTSSLFTFGATGAAPNGDANVSKPSVFGTSTTAFGAAGASSTPAFGTFGSVQSRLGTSTAAPVVGNSSSFAPSTGFNFGQAAAPTVATAVTTPAFNFGGNQPPPAAGNNAVFNFTGNPSSQPASTFGFGASAPMQPQTQPPSQGFNFNPAQEPNFNFGDNGGASSQAYQFSAFDASAASSRLNRPMRKAKRRTK